jgi:hypothetical protein
MSWCGCGWEEKKRKKKFKNVRPYLKNNQSKKGWGCGVWLKWESNCLASSLSTYPCTTRKKEREKASKKEKMHLMCKGQGEEYKMASFFSPMDLEFSVEGKILNELMNCMFPMGNSAI